MVSIISFFNQAGGVGKTTLTQNLGYHLHVKGHRVLLIDLDPQASLTYFMGLEPDNLSESIYQAILEPSRKLPIHNCYGIDFVPSDILLADSEQKLLFEFQREERLKKLLLPYHDSYDYILIDCPPSLTLLPILSLVASHFVVVPIQTQFKAAKGTDSLLATIAKVKQQLNPLLQILAFIPSQFDRRTNTEKRIAQSIKEDLKIIAPVFEPLPRCSAIAEATEWQMPFALSPKATKHRPIIDLFDSYVRQIESLTSSFVSV